VNDLEEKLSGSGVEDENRSVDGFRCLYHDVDVGKFDENFIVGPIKP
jgi:hypothetical protein